MKLLQNWMSKEKKKKAFNPETRKMERPEEKETGPIRLNRFIGNAGVCSRPI